MATEFIRIEGDKNTAKVIGAQTAVAVEQLRRAVKDISEEIRREAVTLAPAGKTGQLKAHPVDIEDSGAGITAGNLPAFGGGFSARGASGRFIRGGAEPGVAVAHIEMTVAKEPAHAIWVHQGTGIFGPHKSPIVPRRSPYLRFEIDGRKFTKRSVLGQKPQPFLTEAFEIVDHSFVPIRVERLRLQIQRTFK